MNRHNFESKDRFPLSTQALTFMQDMILASAQLALIGGDHYILSGCTTAGNNVSDGIIVINGEVMPFKGGTIADTITIIEENIPVTANGETFENARIKRYAKFATGSGANYYPWTNFKPLETNKQLQEAKATVKYVDDAIANIQAGSIPAGVIVMWSGSEAEIPEGWTLCDGKTLKNGKKVPDLQGRFIVGYSRNEALSYPIGKGEKNPDQYKITLTKEQLPVHDHKYNNTVECARSRNNYDQNGLKEKVLEKPYIGLNSLYKDANYLYYSEDTTQTAGDGQSIDIRPPYYVLAFIIKIDIQK